jgi:hypothetical protein
LEYSTKRFIFHGLLLFTVEVREREEKGRENRGRQRERERERPANQKQTNLVVSRANRGDKEARAGGQGLQALQLPP